MNKKSLKRFAAVTLAATMAIGSAVTVFAADDTTPVGVGEGTGSYEGGEIKYPTLSVTLPTIPAGTYDYIADPNGLIAATSNEKYSDGIFTGTTGIFFKTSTNTDTNKDTYTEKSAAQTVTNENAQDIDVTVKLEQKTAGSDIIQYANTATFESTDTANKLYLAVTDDATTNAKVAALSANAAAEIKVTVAGVPANYEPGYNSTAGKYEYTKKDEADLTDWNECSFILTGAINTNATWGDDVTFPEIKVTWSYEEHTDSYLSSSSVSASSTTVTMTLPDGVRVTKVELVNGGTRTALASGNTYTISGTTLGIKSSVVTNNVGKTIDVTYSDGKVDTLTIN